jgi:alkylation response protein AidB-like acyl-CoA dehydrogenase
VDFSEITVPADAEAFWRDEVVPFVDEHLDPATLAREEREGNGFIPAYERALGARGWRTPTAPAERGGAGLDAVRAALLVGEERRRAGVLFPVKGSHALVMDVVQRFASDAIRESVVERAAAGEVTCCLGYTEPDCGSDAAAVKTRAVRDGDDWIITGQKMFSTGAHLCQYAMVTARTNPGVPKHRGITLFLVPLEQPGIERSGIATIGGERTNFIYFDEARVPDTHRLGPVDQGWQVASGALAAEHGMSAEHGGFERAPTADADIVRSLAGVGDWQGVLRRVLDAVVAWARTTSDHEDRPLIDDPVVRRRLARVALDIEVAEATPEPFARVVASDVLIRDTAELVDLCGPAGLIPSGEPGSAADGLVEWAHRFAQGTSIYGGTTDIQRNLIAEQFLGLPRHRGVVRSG